MATPQKWSKVAVAVQSALATAINITAITKANPAVVSYTGTDPVNGDFIVISAQGMFQVDDRVFRVANVNSAGNTLELAGVDSTLFDTFTAGSAQVVTFGTSITTATTISPSGGEFDFIDTSTIHANVRTQMPGDASPATYTMDHIWDVADAGLVALKNASDNQAKRAFKYTFASGQIMVFYGYVGTTLLPGGTSRQLITTQSVFTMNGSPTYYAS